MHCYVGHLRRVHGRNPPMDVQVTTCSVSPNQIASDNAVRLPIVLSMVTPSNKILLMFLLSLQTIRVTNAFLLASIFLLDESCTLQISSPDVCKGDNFTAMANHWRSNTFADGKDIWPCLLLKYTLLCANSCWTRLSEWASEQFRPDIGIPVA